jgi:hypothetical protein
MNFLMAEYGNSETSACARVSREFPDICAPACDPDLCGAEAPTTSPGTYEAVLKDVCLIRASTFNQLLMLCDFYIYFQVGVDILFHPLLRAVSLIVAAQILAIRMF